MKIFRNSFKGFGRDASPPPAWAMVCLLLGGLCPATLAGCGSKSTTDEKEALEKTPAVENVRSDEDVLPKEANFIGKVVEKDFYSDGTVSRKQTVRRYSGETKDSPEIKIKHGPYEEYFSDGQIRIRGEYENGKKAGNWEYRHRNGKRSRTEHYERGKLEGAWSVYREDGTKSDDVSYHNNKKNGFQVEYDEAERKISESEVKDGVQNGVRFEYYPSKQKKAEGHFTDGKYDGLITHWYENGAKKEEVEYRMGVKNGKEIEYDQKGQPISTREYHDGRLVPAKKSG